MKGNIRKILIALLVLVFAVSAVMLVRQLIQYGEGRRANAEAESMLETQETAGTEPVTEPETEEEIKLYSDSYTASMRNMDFSEFRSVNPDVLGYIMIPDTEVSYPLLQADDNEYYLTRTWENTESVMGSIFLECQCSPDLTDFNTIVYGHRMKNGSMFATLKYYNQLSYRDEHPKVYITNDEGCRCYEIFAAYEVSTSGTTYRLGFKDDAARQEFIDFGLENSVIDTGVTPEADDLILTLSTCTGNGHATRWVVQAVLLGIDPADE